MKTVKKLHTAWSTRKEKGYITLLERLIPALTYLFLYLKWFDLLEDANRSSYVIVHTELDDMIPFAEIFAIPYYLWFFYVIATLTFLILLPRSEDYYKALFFMCAGMTVFLLFSTFVPTLQPLRPAVMPRDNVFTHMIARLYMTDTPTNVFPSIHVYNSIACVIALNRVPQLDRHKWVRVSAGILSALVILSTMLIKQHSVIDVAGAFVMAFVFYRITYQSDFVVNAMHIREREFSLSARSHS